MPDGVFIRFDVVRPLLELTSRKQKGALFMAILDYAEDGLEPKPYDKGPFTEWLCKVFPAIKEMIDGWAEMAKRKDGRPLWFRFWLKDADLLLDEGISMESRGRIITSALLYFKTGEESLFKLSETERIFYRQLKKDIDESLEDWNATSQRNSENQKKRWEKYTSVYGGIRVNTSATEEKRKEKKRKEYSPGEGNI